MRTIATFLTLLFAAGALGAPVPYEIKVLDRGATPRALYEYAPVAGTEESVSVRVEHDQKIAMGVMEREMILPVTIARADIAVDAAPLATGVSASVTLEEIAVEDRDGVPEGLLPVIENALAAFQPVSGRFEASASGRVSDFTLDATTTVAGGLFDGAAQVSGALQSMMIQLPEVPIGEGAEWTVTSQIPQAQYTITQVTTYTLWKVDAHRLAVRVTITQSIPSDTPVSDVSGGWEGKVIEFYGEGSGTIAVALNQLSPLLSDLSIASRIVIEAEMDGEKARSAMASTTSVKLEGRVVK